MTYAPHFGELRRDRARNSGSVPPPGGNGTANALVCSVCIGAETSRGSKQRKRYN
jgi:hypothetical protein